MDAPPRPTLSPHEVLRVFEEFVRRDIGKPRVVPETLGLGRSSVLAGMAAPPNRRKRS